ncbi:hypothetical protein [Actinomadura craniellae]|uniref:hypothetical protein n=1 Tax=Actinomadura craniellae TaxID=2231787 RepID=UPI0011BF975C|nr:hypothetical protein [Actinomadura craniellae]
MPAGTGREDPGRLAGIRAAQRELRARFPSAVIWYGRATGRWWATVDHQRGPGRLYKARIPAELAALLHGRVGSPPRRPPVR